MPQLSAVLPLKVEPHKTNSYEVARNLFRSLVKFGGTGVFETFYIVCHGGHEALLLDEFDEFRENLSIKIIDEDALVPELSDYPDISGWRKQQILKLAISKLMNTPYFITFDADAICTHPISEQILLPEGKGLLHPVKDNTRKIWWTSSAAELGIRTPQVDGMNVTPAILSTDVCKGLIRELDSKKNWVHRLMKPHRKWSWKRLLLPWFKSTYHWTEYTLYYLFMYKHGLIDQYHITAGTASIPQTLVSANSVWKRTNFENWDPSLPFSNSDPALFCIIQSNKNIPPDVVWKKISDYIQ